MIKDPIFGFVQIDSTVPGHGFLRVDFFETQRDGLRARFLCGFENDIAESRGPAPFLDAAELLTLRTAIDQALNRIDRPKQQLDRFLYSCVLNVQDHDAPGHVCQPG